MTTPSAVRRVSTAFVLFAAGAAPRAALAIDPLTASFVVTTPGPLGEGSSPKFAGTLGGKRRGYTYVYDWNFGDRRAGAWENRGTEPGHLYVDNGNYNVVFRVTEKDGAGQQTRRVESAPRTVSIVNQPPIGAISGAPASSLEAVEIVLNSTVGDPGREDRSSLRRAWSVSGGPITTGNPGTDKARFIFTPTNSGTFTVALDVTDKDGGTTRITKTIDIRNQAPTGQPGGPYQAFAGRPMQVVGTIDDASAEDAARAVVHWDFGDGTAGATGLVASHTYDASVPVGRKTITMTIDDPDGGTTTPTTTQLWSRVRPCHSRTASTRFRVTTAGCPVVAAQPASRWCQPQDHWSTLEPQDGVFDWSMLDRHFERAEAAGKGVALCVSAGLGAPQWLSTAAPCRSPSLKARTRSRSRCPGIPSSSTAGPR